MTVDSLGYSTALPVKQLTEGMRPYIVGDPMALEKELDTFGRLKASLVANHNGKFALIKGVDFLGAFDTAENAYAEGIKRFGRSEFLVKKISEKEEIYTNKALQLGLMNAHI